jgi:hypothetical protein
MTRTPTELWLLELERERFDTSWRQPKPERYAPTAPIVVKATKPADPKLQRERDRIMFHAGRYAAGVRDQEAIDANSRVGGLINGKGSK